jgi:hypothetical protein
MVRLVQTVHLSCVNISIISNELTQASTWASSLRSSIGCVQNDFWAYGMFSTNHAPTLNRQQHYLQMDQNTIPHDPRHLGLPSGASKTISELVVRSAQTMPYLASRLAISLNDLDRASTWASSPRVPSGASKSISEPVVRLAQTVHPSCVKISTIFKLSESNFHLSLAT